MSVMKVVRRTDRNVINLFAAAAQLIDVAIEPLKLHEEMRFGKMTV